MGNARARLDMISLNLNVQICHSRGASSPLQPAVLIHSHTTGIITTVFKPLEPFKQDGNNISGTDSTHDAAHGKAPS
jgi:hypothetical protein